ncbi:MAG: 50S ribosomal protein L4 [Patescibacteria group bacterium]|nr:50S ribosomal protein L4 [Patescibacteria group bacterium]
MEKQKETKQRKKTTKTEQVEKPKKQSVTKSVMNSKKSRKNIDLTNDQKEIVVENRTKMSVDVFSPDGKRSEIIELPENIFDAEINNQLMAQAVRVYHANQREGSASTKTRGEVEGSTRKIYRQKGTGRARHGSIRAPIFVKGGIVFGPKPRDYSLNLPKKMKKKAIISALTLQRMNNAIKIADGIENLELKTKVFHSFFQSLGTDRQVLFLYAKDELPVVRAVRNLPYVDSMRAVDVHTYAVLCHRYILMTKNALRELQTVFV